MIYTSVPGLLAIRQLSKQESGNLVYEVPRLCVAPHHHHTISAFFYCFLKLIRKDIFTLLQFKETVKCATFLVIRQSYLGPDVLTTAFFFYQEGGEVEKAGPYKTKKRGLIGDILMIYSINSQPNVIRPLQLYSLKTWNTEKKKKEGERRKGKEERKKKRIINCIERLFQQALAFYFYLNTTVVVQTIKIYNISYIKLYKKTRHFVCGSLICINIGIVIYFLISFSSGGI